MRRALSTPSLINTARPGPQRPAERHEKSRPARGGFAGVADDARLARRHHHHDLAAFHFRKLLDLGDFLEIVLHAFQQVGAAILVGHFPPAKAQRHLDLVALLEEALHRLDLHLIVVVVDVGPHLDLLDLDDLLLLLGLGLFLLLLVFVLAVIKDLAHRRLGVRRDLDKVKAGLLCDGERPVGRDDTALLAGVVNQKNLGNRDILVDARPVVLGRGGGDWSACYVLLSMGCCGTNTE